MALRFNKSHSKLYATREDNTHCGLQVTATQRTSEMAFKFTNYVVLLKAGNTLAQLWTLSAPMQHTKSEEVGCWPPEPLGSLIGCVLAVHILTS